MSAPVLKYTVVRNHPETGVPHPLVKDQPVPDWAEGLVDADDLYEVAPVEVPSPEGDASSPEAVAAAEERAEAAEKTAREAEEALEKARSEYEDAVKASAARITELEGELASLKEDGDGATGQPDAPADASSGETPASEPVAKEPAKKTAAKKTAASK